MLTLEPPLHAREQRLKELSKKAKIRIGRLNTVGGVVTELGRVYREARRGDLDIGEATRLTYILREIRCALEAGDIEGRRVWGKILDAVRELTDAEPPDEGEAVH